jgi:hypothetical protein
VSPTVPPGAKAPADHLAPAVAVGPDPLTFTGIDGVAYTLPPPTDALALLPGRALRDAMMGGDEGEVRFGFVALETAVTDKATLDALYDLPAPDMMRIVGAWIQSMDTSGGSLPEA